MTKERNLNIEALRVAMMLLIVIMHIGGGSTDMDLIHTLGGANSGTFVAYRSLTFLGVSTFAFISGFYGVNLKPKRIVDMEIMALTYGVAILAITYFWFRMPTSIEVRESLFPVTFQRLWYFSAYMLLMFISPIINKGIENIDKRTFQIIVCALLIWVYVIRLYFGCNDCSFINMLTIYLVGRYLRSYPIALIKDNASKIFITCVLFKVLVSFALGYFAFSNIYVRLEGNNNPVTFLCSIALFYSVYNITYTIAISRIVSPLAKYMLSVYVISELLRLVNIIDISWINGNIVYVIPAALITMLGCVIIERVRMFLYAPLEKMIERLTCNLL